eukprot:gene4475-6120_t
MHIDRLRGVLTVMALVATTALAASPARADRCDDLALQLKSQIDGLSVGRTAANVIYLSHPAAKQLRLGCASRAFSNELYAASDTRKPPAAFANLVASAAAIVFTIPKPDTLKGATRCLGRIALVATVRRHPSAQVPVVVTRIETQADDADQFAGFAQVHAQAQQVAGAVFVLHPVNKRPGRFQ